MKFRHRTQRVFLRAVLFSIVSCGLVAADNPLFQMQGIGTRALGMGNAYVALSDDFSASYWNPGGLAFCPVRELQFSLEQMNDKMTGAFGAFSDSTDIQRFRFRHIGWLRSIPTSQGGFSFALGYSKPFLMDNGYVFHGPDVFSGEKPLLSDYYTIKIINKDTILVFDTVRSGDTLLYEEAKNEASGSVDMFSFAAGWQIAQGIGFGVSASLLSGDEAQTSLFKTTHRGKLFENSKAVIDRSYMGIDIRAGFMAKMVPWFTMGALIAAPQKIWMDQQYRATDRQTNIIFSPVSNSGSMTSSFSGAVGASMKLPFCLLSAQVNGRAPQSQAPKGSGRAAWQGGGAAGVEVPVPFLPVVLRGGYRKETLDLYPYGIKWSGGYSFIEPILVRKEKVSTLTGGFSVLIKNALTLDGAYSFTTREYSLASTDWRNTNDEKHSTYRFQGSVSYRY